MGTNSEFYKDLTKLGTRRRVEQAIYRRWPDAQCNECAPNCYEYTSDLMGMDVAYCETTGDEREKVSCAWRLAEEKAYG